MGAEGMSVESKTYIEIPTAERSPAWLAEQASTIGGSSAAAVLSQSRFRTARQVWQRMRAARFGELPEPGRISDDMMRGIMLEPLARTLLARELKVPIRPHDQDQFVYAEEYPWAHTLPDGWAGEIPVELKCPRPGTVARCNLAGLLTEWEIQAQHMMAVTHRPRCCVGLLDPITVRIHPFWVELHPEFVRDMMAGEEAFWNTLEAGPPPDEVPTEEAPTDAGVPLILSSDEAIEAASVFLRLRELENETAEAKELAKGRLREMSGNAASFVVPGIAKIYDRQTAGRRSMDRETIEKLYPAVAADDRIWKTSKPSRTFTAYAL